jgi:sensor domain CHASE-containing protein
VVVVDHSEDDFLGPTVIVVDSDDALLVAAPIFVDVVDSDDAFLGATAIVVDVDHSNATTRIVVDVVDSDDALLVHSYCC